MAEQTDKMVLMTNLQLITCILQRGKADTVVDAAIEAGAPAATVSFGRGTGIRQRLGLLKFAISPEKEIIEIIVPDEKADHVFGAMVKVGKLDTPGMGLIYMMPVSKALICLPAAPGT
jgi:nitrogen regulatory protein PII